MPLTKLSRTTLVIFVGVSVYGYFGLLQHHWLTFLCLLFSTMAYGWSAVLGNEIDIDVMAGFVLRRRGALPPKGKSMPPQMQNMVWWCRKLPTRDELQRLVEDKFITFDRLRRELINPKAPIYESKFQWVDENENFDLNDIVQLHLCKDETHVLEVINEICNQVIPIDTVQWRFHLLQNQTEGELSSGIFRVSHGVADGLRLVAIGANLFSNKEGKPIPMPTVGKLKSGKPKKVNGRGIGGGNPLSIIKQFFSDAKAVDAMSNGSFDTINPFKPDLKNFFPEKSTIYRWDKPVPLDVFKKLKSHYNVSVNDIMTAAFAGGLRKYMMFQDPQIFEKIKPSEFQTRAMVAFSFPEKRKFRYQHDWLRNDFSFVSWPIPAQIESFEKRVNYTFDAATKLKKSFQPWLLVKGGELLCRLGLENFAEKSSANAFARHSCVFSNVPGWNEPLYFFGSEVEKIEASYFNVVPQFIFISYNENVYATMVINDERFPKAEMILTTIAEELYAQHSELS